MYEAKWEFEGMDESSVVAHEICIISYFDEDGNACYALGTRGEATDSARIGLLEIVKHKMLNGGQ